MKINYDINTLIYTVEIHTRKRLDFLNFTNQII